MSLRQRTAALGLLLFAAGTTGWADDKTDEGFVPMFNGRDLTGWVNVNCAPSTFYVKDNEIITTGKPTGYLRTERQYENFIAEFDWMHVPPAPGAVGNSGFFVWADPIPAVGTGYTRGIEVQVLVNLTYRDKKTNAVTATSQGDLFSIWGATCIPDRPHPLGWSRCLPSEDHCKGEGEWNHYRVEANNGTIKLAVNGKVVSGLSQCNPRKGYLALESEGSECHFRNLKIKELPSTNPKPDAVAVLAQEHKTLYTGLDLSGWTAEGEGARREWKPRDTVLDYVGEGTPKDRILRTIRTFADAEFIVDFSFPPQKAGVAPHACTFLARSTPEGEIILTIFPDGTVKIGDRYKTKFSPANVEGKTRRQRETTSLKSGASNSILKPVGRWNRLVLTLERSYMSARLNDHLVADEKMIGDAPKGAFGLDPQGEMDFCNLFVRELKK